ncbi:hypothetical protein CMQ_7307 [Grosmannia clavigera kw1407]|uniref:AMP-activated protein kinase glycogen-binding domain-containing protein n=1 Tax=Grosmannia clavigera (strain kw1407 / UAMH 11150) TaxID=655863 RepID=F0XQ70_GROCL|nr:uncharacterized protein CMQ_7307 [Grosmannia clavigera kw1407]EFX00305.1 hypothetical protein CMQ_7307 [Grosmannia clavigera kw1407]
MNTEPSSVKISYKSAEIHPPLFIAGSYSSPPWTPQEMEHSKTENGEQIFTKTIKGSPGTIVEYKFRVGTGDCAHVERPPTPPPDSPPPHVLGWDRIEIGPSLGHENLASADDGRSSTAPMFAYELAAENDTVLSEKALSHVSASEEAIDEAFDPNDPTLERFPSNRDEILEKVRTIETGLNEDRTSFDGIPLSPVVGPGRRHSNEPVVDMLPTDSGADRSEVRLESHTVSRSRDSLRPSISGASLHCIVEESAVEESVGEFAVEEATVEEAAVEISAVELSAVELPAVELSAAEISAVEISAVELPAVDVYAVEKQTGDDEQVPSRPQSAGNDAAVPEPDTHLSAGIEASDPSEADIDVAEEPELAGSEQDQDSEQRETTPRALEAVEAAVVPADVPGVEDGEATDEAQLSSPVSTGIKVTGNDNWLASFFRLVFVDWIGAFFARLFNWRRA